MDGRKRLQLEGRGGPSSPTRCSQLSHGQGNSYVALTPVVLRAGGLQLLLDRSCSGSPQRRMDSRPASLPPFQPHRLLL